MLPAALEIAALGREEGLELVELGEFEREFLELQVHGAGDEARDVALLVRGEGGGAGGGEGERDRGEGVALVWRGSAGGGGGGGGSGRGDHVGRGGLRGASGGGGGGVDVHGVFVLDFGGGLFLALAGLSGRGRLLEFLEQRAAQLVDALARRGGRNARLGEGRQEAHDAHDWVVGLRKGHPAATEVA